MNDAPLIYDVGMNNGDDTAFYLACGYRVVAIEAQADLCAMAHKRFAQEIAQGRLTILNLGVGPAPGALDLYVPDGPDGHVRGTLVPPDLGVTGWTKIKSAVEVVPLSILIAAQGFPYFVKIDVEGMDGAVLSDLADHKLTPAYLSAEAHDEAILDRLVAMGYQNFKITDCNQVAANYANAVVGHVSGAGLLYHFPPHSSGPFGPDVFGPWLSEAAVRLLFRARHTLWGPSCWVDLHAGLIV